MENPNKKLHSIILHRNLPGRRWKILRLLTRVEDFKTYMPNVREAKIHSRDKKGVITEWWVDVDGLPIHWKQEDRFDGAHFELHFKSTEGDLDRLEGKWSLKKGAFDSTDVTLQVEVELGIPILEDVIGDTLKNRIQKNFEMTLLALEEKLIGHRYQVVDGKVRLNEGLKGFVVMGHPYNFQHLIRIFKVFKPDVLNITPEFLLKIFELAPSYRSSDISNFRSATGQTIDGHFVMCPIIPDMALLSPEIVLAKVIEGCRIGEKLGAGILALGGFTSIVGEKYFDKLRSHIKIPITTGNAFTAAMALASVRHACEVMGIPMKNARAAIVGGTGDIGSACARVLVREVRELVITGRTPTSVREMHEMLKKEGGAEITSTLDNNEGVKGADIIIAAASSSQSVVNVDAIKPGAVVCDVGYPKNIAYSAKHRTDILVFSGGLCSVPTPFNLGFDVGLPSPSILYGCFSEAIILALEGRYENFSEGKGKLMPEKIKLIEELGAKHGFTQAPFFWGDQQVDDKRIELILQAKARVA